MAALFLCAAATAATANGQSWLDMELPERAQQLNARAAEAETPEDARRLYAQAVKAASSNAPALFALGCSYLEAGEADKALAFFKRIERYFPNDAASQAALAVTLLQLPQAKRTDIESGIRHAQRAVELDGGDPEHWNLLSLLYHANGDYEAADAAAGTAVRLARDARMPPETLARFQQQKAACEDALSIFTLLE